jgi:hypothetical protein
MGISSVSLNCFSTCTAEVGLSIPNLFALGAAIGLPNFFIRDKIVLLLDILIAIVFVPALSSLQIFEFSFLFKTIVRGPGQKSFTIFSILSSNMPIDFA